MTQLTVSPALADACPRCTPGDVPASRPSRIDVAGGQLAAAYVCAACGTAWRTWWELAGTWPAAREVCKSVTEMLDELIAMLANLLDGELGESTSPSQEKTVTA